MTLFEKNKVIFMPTSGGVQTDEWSWPGVQGLDVWIEEVRLSDRAERYVIRWLYSFAGIKSAGGVPLSGRCWRCDRPTRLSTSWIALIRNFPVMKARYRTVCWDCAMSLVGEFSESMIPLAQVPVRRRLKKSAQRA